MSLKKVSVLTVLLLASVSTSFGKVTIAEIPVKVNVPALVTLAQVTPQTGVQGDQKSVTAAGATVTLEITVDQQKTSVLHRSHGNASAPAVARYGNGTVTLQLSAPQYRNAAVTLYSVNGKRVLSGKAAASNGALNISRANVASGVYLLSVKGVDGNSYSTRLTHSGGRLNINGAFGGGDVLSLGKETLAKSMSSGTWKLTAAAEGYETYEATFTPNLGMNELRDVTLEPVSSGGNTFVDSRDSQTYKQVTIGGQVWMAENLNYEMSDSWCYDNNTSNCATYGRLYTWDAAITACPSGWHLPSHAEWDDLIRAVDPTHTSGTNHTASSKLKSQTGWNSYSGISSTDEFGFSALPGGRHNSQSGNFLTAGNYGYWWSATEQDATRARYRNMFYENDQVGWDIWDKMTSLSVRCLRD